MSLENFFINSASELLDQEKVEKFFLLLSNISNYDQEGLDNLVSKILTNVMQYKFNQDPVAARQFWVNQNKLIRVVNNNLRLKFYLKLLLT